MRAAIFAAVIMAAVSVTAIEEEDNTPPETWDNMCYHCVNEGNLYCVKGVSKASPDTGFNWPTATGTCMEANCKT